MPRRLILAAVAGPMPWNLATGKLSTKAGPISGVITNIVRLTLVGGQLCEELVVGHACRGSEACVGADLGPDLLGNGRGVGNALQVLGHDEVSLIER